MQVISDKSLIMRILSHEDIWPRIIGDLDITPDEYTLPDDCLYLTETGKEVFIMEPNGRIHANMLPESRGNAWIYCKRFIAYLFENTDKSTLYLNIRKKHLNAIKLGLMCGFNIAETSEDKAYLRIEKCRS